MEKKVKMKNKGEDCKKSHTGCRIYLKEIQKCDSFAQTMVLSIN